MPEAAWTKLNCGAVGFYRVQYEKSYSSKFNVGKLMIRDRLQLQSDTFALAKAGYIPVTDYFDLLSKYADENEYTVMGDILKNLGEVSLWARNLDQSTQENFRKWKLNLLQKLKVSLGWTKKESDSHSAILLRSKVMDTLGKCGDPEIVKEARQMFADHLSGKKEIDGDLRAAVYQTMASNAESEDDLKKLTKLWEDNKESQEQQALVERSIGYVKDNKEYISFAVDFIKSIKACNVPFAFVGLCYGSQAGADATWDFIQNNMDWIKTNCQGFLLQAMFSRTLCVFGSAEKYSEIKKFFEDLGMQEGKRAISQMLEKIDVRSKAVDRDGEAIVKYFQ